MSGQSDDSERELRACDYDDTPRQSGNLPLSPANLKVVPLSGAAKLGKEEIAKIVQHVCDQLSSYTGGRSSLVQCERDLVAVVVEHNNAYTMFIGLALETIQMT